MVAAGRDWPGPYSSGPHLPGGYSPRRWWAGPLDVEGLALRSVAAAAEALNQYGVAATAVRLLDGRRETGVGGSARLSLARTAEELFALPANTESRGEVPAPHYMSMDSTYGELRYVGPPLLAGGQPVDYLSPPPPYGSSTPTWV
jgi:hypothetical protein